MESGQWQVPDGFSLASGTLRLRGSEKDDCLLILCDEPATASGVFTNNVFSGAPVLLNKKHLQTSQGKTRAILVNTVYSNAGTGKEGSHNAETIAVFLAKTLNVNTELVLLASTGKIGPQLPVEKFLSGLPAIVQHPDNDILRAAKAILTTDLVEKIEYRQLSGGASILGIAKGSGMIAPNMATMLAFVLSDAVIDKDVLDYEWKRICRATFNQVSVDNCQSTSDMALVVLSGKKPTVTEEFFLALKDIATCLAKKIAADGEGATHLLEVTARNCADEKTAQILAKAVVTSDLFKAAVAGHDPNWGRICSAIGSAMIPFDPQRIDIFLDGSPVFLAGDPILSPDTSKMFLEKLVSVEIDFHTGLASAQAWGCDLTKKYVEINAEYST